jgi:hypothetical protein
MGVIPFPGGRFSLEEVLAGRVEYDTAQEENVDPD